jgi:ABC-2 type transport system permease protein
VTDLLLFRTTLREQMRIGRLLTTGLLVALPPMLAFVWHLVRRRDFDPTVAYNTLSGGIVFGFTLVILAVIFSTGAVSQDLERQTIVYLLTRPVPRWRILLAKFAASLVFIIATVWLSSAALALVAYGPARLSEARLLRDLAILPIGALAYGSLFLFLATFIRWALLLGLLFAFGWESWVPSLPGDFSKVSLMAYLRVLAPHPQPKSLSGGELQDVLASLNPQSISHALAWVVLSCVTFAALAGAIVVFSEREYAPREDAG